MLDFRGYSAEKKELLIIGSIVLVFVSYIGKSRQDSSFETPFCRVYEIERDKMLQLRQFTDTVG